MPKYCTVCIMQYTQHVAYVREVLICVCFRIKYCITRTFRADLNVVSIVRIFNSMYSFVFSIECHFRGLNLFNIDPYMYLYKPKKAILYVVCPIFTPVCMHYVHSYFGAEFY
jgi:hypothetical protein